MQGTSQICPHFSFGSGPQRTDVRLGWTSDDTRWAAAVYVNNLFDKQPPLLYENNTNNANTDAMNFDLIGRYYWARWTVAF